MSTKKEENEHLVSIIEKSKRNDKDAQKELFTYMKRVSTPIAYSLKNTAFKSGLNDNDLEACIYDTMCTIMFQDDFKNVKNLDSYFKTSYRYSVIAKIRENLNFYKHFSLGLLEGDDGDHSLNMEALRAEAMSKKDRKRDIIIDVLDTNRKYFSKTEFSILLLLIQGYNLNEIVDLLNTTKYQVYRNYDSAVKRMKKIIKGIFPILQN